MSNSSGRHAAGALLAAAIAGLVLSVGCLQPIDPVPCGNDGGTHGGDDGGGNNGGTDAGDGNDAGTDGGDTGMDAGTDGGPGEDGGMIDAGVISRADAGPFSWAAIPGTGTSQTVNAVHGTSPSNVYIATSDGQLQRSTGGAFSDVLVLPGSTPPSLEGVWVTPNGNVFAGGYNTLVACTNGSCTQASDFTVTNTSTLTPMYGSIEALCGRGDDVVYAVGSYASSGRIWQYDFDAGEWVVRVANTQTGTGRNCIVADNGDAFVAGGYGSLLRVTPTFLSFVEPINEISGFDPSTWLSFAVIAVNGRYFATGDEKIILERDNMTKTWNVVENPDSFYENYALAALAPDELYASGSPESNRALQRFDGDDWTFVTDSDPRALPYWMTVYSMWTPDPDTIFVAGQRSSDGIVLMGTR